jgi:hypothetical protein
MRTNHPEGATYEGKLCYVIRDLGRIEERVALSEPWELGSGDKVILLEGIRGGYSFDRVQLKTNTLNEREVIK